MAAVFCSSESKLKLIGIESGFWLERGEGVQAQGLPVDLPQRADLEVNEQPEGYEQTLMYARARDAAMVAAHPQVQQGIRFSIESGAIDGMDVAIVLAYAGDREFIAQSQPLPFPEGSLEEARKRGFKTTTAGMIIHEWDSAIPANNWQEYFTKTSRPQQIAGAVRDVLRQIAAAEQ
jgi:non-canonical (house-cleaning) NTP pyrophosphatase